MGTTEVTYTAKDKTGNTARYTFNVTVKSAAAPVFSNCPSDVLIKTTELSGAEAMWEPPVASDDCEVPVITVHHFPLAIQRLPTQQSINPVIRQRATLQLVFSLKMPSLAFHKS
jgi:hypothetical protein